MSPSVSDVSRQVAFGIRGVIAKLGAHSTRLTIGDKFDKFPPPSQGWCLAKRYNHTCHAGETRKSAASSYPVGPSDLQFLPTG